DHALTKISKLREFVKQDMSEKSSFEEAKKHLFTLIEQPL
ncbi:MAG: hypothetical protein ACM34N_03085, partial [Ignavibacteria bacterium]